MPTSEPARLLIVERQPVVTPEVRTRIGREPGFAVVGRVASAVEATRLVRDQPVDLVLIESTLPEPGAIELARFLRVRFANTVVAIATRAASQVELFEAARVGAHAYLRASTDPDVFVATLRRALAGEFPIDEEVVRYRQSPRASWPAFARPSLPWPSQRPRPSTQRPMASHWAHCS